MNQIKSISLIFAIMLLLSGFAFADLGPKPTVEIQLTYNGSAISDKEFNAAMLGCFELDKYWDHGNIIQELNVSVFDLQKNCYWKPAPLAWGGDCKDNKCNFNYMPPSEFRLAVFLPSQSKVFISNTIDRKNFNSNYKANLLPNGTATISETTAILENSQFSSFAMAFILTMAIELLVGLVFVSIFKISKKILITIALANLISLPIVWFGFPQLAPSIGTIGTIFSAEAFAVLFETAFLFKLNKQLISLKKALLLSVLMNAASLFIGGFILIILFFFGI